MKDSEIKLFGKKIALPETSKIVSPVTSDEFSGDDIEVVDSVVFGCDQTCLEVTRLNKMEVAEEKGVGAEHGAKSGESQEEEADEEHAEAEPSDTSQQDMSLPAITEGLTNSEVLPEADDNPKTPSIDEESSTPTASKTENDQSNMTDSQQKTLKKPDKILPCPRCNSMETKFCYYNNYNINQPRHFCKSCQRYWTAGGTMRNVPVGAGRRKNKNSASDYRHITISEALQAARIDPPNGIHHPALNTNGTVLSFGPDLPLCESMASVVNPAEKKAPNGTRSGFYKIEHVPVSSKGRDNGEDCSNASCVTTSSSMAEGGKNGPPEPMIQNIPGFPSQIPCLPGVPWPCPCPWNSAVPVPAICPSGFAMPFFPAPYWNCSVSSAWSIPWLSPSSSSTGQKSPSSNPNSPTLGKHSRNGELLKPANSGGKESPEKKNSESSILVPKALRIDDPEEAAKSSIWATLGIKNESMSKGGFFKAFQPKSDEKNHMMTASPVLQANPAAMYRSLSFQETA